MPLCADIFYRQYNSGNKRFDTPVILLHGGGGTHMGWPSDLRRLPNQNIIAIDLPGHGRSKHPACLSLKGLVNRLQDFFTCMGFYHVALVGFSLGGALALEYASSFPEKVSKLAVISCGTHFNIPDGIMHFLRPPVNNKKATKVFSDVAFHLKTTPTFRRKIIEPLFDLDPLVLAADFHMGSKFRAVLPEKKLGAPFLILGGGDDQIATPQSLRLLKPFSSHTRFEIIPDAGHMLIYEKTRQVRDCLVEFLGERD